MRPVPKPSRRVKTLAELKEQIGRKKVRKEACPLEESEQMALAGWLDAIGVLWCHVPNGGHRHKLTAIRLKRQGVKRGVPDILIFDRPYPVENGKLYTGVAIELKRNDKTAKASLGQVEWMAMLTDRGWLCKVCHGADEAIEWLKVIGYGLRRQGA